MSRRLLPLIEQFRPQKKICAVGALLFASLAGIAGVQAGASPEVVAATRSGALDLNSAVALALQNNFGVSIRRLEKLSAAEDIEIAKAGFEPNLDATVTRNADARFNGVSTGQYSGYSATLSQKIITGGIIGLNANTAKTDNGFGFNSTDPYDSELHLTFRQPLLRGGGLAYNRAPLQLGKIGVAESDYELRKSILDLLRNVEIAYWEVAIAYRERDLRQETISDAERLLRETNARGNVGLATGIEPLQAEQALAARREEAILVQQAIDDRTDRLMLLLGKLDRNRFRVEPPADFPNVQPRVISDLEIDALIAKLPDYQQFDNQLTRRKILADRARNEALPIVDVTLGTGYTGFGNGYFNAYDRAFRSDQRDFQALLEMRVPLGFRNERATLRKRRIELEIDQLRKREFEQNLRAQIREAVHAVAAGRERVRVTSGSYNLSSEQSEQLRAKFRAGLTTFRDMLLVQDDFRDANIRALRARVDAIEASIRLARFDGSLLARYGLLWGDPAEQSSHK